MSEFERLMKQAEDEFEQANELRNAEITHVSYVDKPANGKKFFLTKSAEQSEPIKKSSTLEAMKEILQAELKPLTERLEAVEEKRAIQKAKKEYEQKELYQLNKAAGMKAVHSSAVLKAIIGEHNGADV